MFRPDVLFQDLLLKKSFKLLALGERLSQYFMILGLLVVLLFRVLFDPFSNK